MKLFNLDFKKLQQLQTGIPIAYLIVVLIGMLFEYRRYKIFGINIFQYADVFDFLIAPFKDFLIVSTLFFTVFIWVGLYQLDLFLRKFPKFYYYFNFGLTKKKWYETYVKYVFICGALIYVLFGSFTVGEITKKQVLQNKNEIEITYADNEVVKGSLIGKTKEVIFLYVDGKVKIIPSTAYIKQVSFDKKIHFKKQ